MRVLVVDRSCAFAEALAHLLQKAGIDAAHAKFESVAAVADRLRPTLAVVDADAEPGRIRAAVDAARAADGVRVLLLTRGGNGDCEGLAERLGAVGWITRHATADGLLGALRRGHTANGPGAVRPTPRHGLGGRRSAEVNELVRLSPRELEVLRHLMAGRRNEDLADTLGISPNTVRTHVQNILAKTGVRTRFEAVDLARRAGLQPAAVVPSGGAG